jgi:hypothetical protein
MKCGTAVGKCDEMSSLRRHSLRWEHNIKVDLKGMGEWMWTGLKEWASGCGPG